MKPASLDAVLSHMFQYFAEFKMESFIFHFLRVYYLICFKSSQLIIETVTENGEHLLQL